MTIIIGARYDSFVVLAADTKWHSTVGEIGSRTKLVAHPFLPLAFGSRSKSLSTEAPPRGRQVGWWKAGQIGAVVALHLL